MSSVHDKTWYAVVNPNAGSGKTLAKWREAEGLMYSRNIQYKFITPESPSDSVAHIRAACEAGYRRFMAVGGDGTVHHLLCNIAEYVASCQKEGVDIHLDDFTLVVFPIGSGNDWLRSHNIPRDYSKIIDLMAEGKFFKQDVVKAEVFNAGSGRTGRVSYMANVGGYSFDANVCDVVNFQKSHGITGKMLYINALRRIALSQKISRARIVCDGVIVFDDELYSISFGNGKYSGGGLCQTPSAVMDDGLIDMMIAPKFQLWRVFFCIKKLLQKKTEKIKFVKFFKAKDIYVYPEAQGELVEIDGDIIGRAPLHLSVMDERINVLHLESGDDRGH